MVAAPANHRRVVGGGDHSFAWLPDELRLLVMPARGLNGAAEADLVGTLTSLELPGIAVGEPGLGELYLPTVGHLLAKKAVHITDAIAIGGNVDGRH